MLISAFVKSLEKNAMAALVPIFLSVLIGLFSLIVGGNTEAKTVTKDGVSYSCDYNCSNCESSQLVNRNSNCRPDVPPAFRNPPQQAIPQQLPPIVSAVTVANDGHLSVIGLILCICAAVAGGFAGYRKEKAIDELTAEAEAAKEKAFVEAHSAKAAAAKLAGK